MQITINTQAARFTMRGGFGVNWHAINDGPMTGAGSAWGANPPAEDKAGWQAVYAHAEWLGLDFVRACFAQSSYQPGPTTFDWQTPDMRALYRILDWCEQHGADVIMQQQWNGVEWNRYDDVDALHSAPREIAPFASGFATLAEYLVRERGYRCIKWACITNEPREGWGWWRGPGDLPISTTPALAAVRAELDARGLDIPLIAPDWIGLRACDPAEIDFDHLIGAYDLHTYLEQYDLKPVGTTEPEQLIQDWVNWANRHGKPFFLTEFGSMNFGLYHDNPGPGTYAAGMKNVEQMLRGLHCGIEGFCRWSFTNRGDLDGQWQLIDTWDVARQQLRPTFTPHPNVYALYGMVSRFVAKGSTVLECTVSGYPAHREGTGWQQYGLATALRSPNGALTVIVQNLTEQDVTVQITLQGLGEPLTLHHYHVGQAARNQVDVALDPTRSIKVTPEQPMFEDVAPGLSVTVYSTYLRQHNQPGVTDERT